MPKIAVIAVPFIFKYEHQLFLQQTIQSLLKSETSSQLDLIAIINAYHWEESGYKWIENTFNYIEVNDQNNLARAWNKGIRLGFERGADYCLVINPDLCFHNRYLENLVRFAESNPEAIIWSGAEWPEQHTLESVLVDQVDGVSSRGMTPSAFMLDRRLFEKVGMFDEDFKPAYHEDTDMIYRIHLSGQFCLMTSNALFYHYNRSTIEVCISHQDNEFLAGIRHHLDRGLELYQKKWGGVPGEEKFLTPYNK